MAPKDIRSSFENLCYRPDELKSKGSDAREEIDLKVGFAFSKFLSSRFHKLFIEFKKQNTVISYGPCQFPAFWFCHQRALEIEQFKPKKYWKAVASVVADTGSIVDLNYENFKFKSLEETKEILKNLNNK